MVASVVTSVDESGASVSEIKEGIRTDAEVNVADAEMGADV